MPGFICVGLVIAEKARHFFTPIFGRAAIAWLIIRKFVTRAVSANILNLRRRQSLGEEDGGSEV